MAKTETKPSFVVLVPVQTVVVHRDGKPVVPAIGQPFEFTSEEAEQIKKMSPGAVTDQAVVPAADAMKKEEEGL